MEIKTPIFSTCDQVPKLPIDNYSYTILPIMQAAYKKTDLQLINPVDLNIQARTGSYYPRWEDDVSSGTFIFDDDTTQEEYNYFYNRVEEGNAWLDAFTNNVPALEAHVLELLDDMLENVRHNRICKSFHISKVDYGKVPA